MAWKKVKVQPDGREYIWKPDDIIDNFICCHCGKKRTIKKLWKYRILTKHKICTICTDKLLKNMLDLSNLGSLFDIVKFK